MAARDSQYHAVHFFSAGSNRREEMLEKESARFPEASQAPPPVSLSLRTRENSALVCKRIFDQIYSCAESNPNNNNDKINNSEFQGYKRGTLNQDFQGDRKLISPQMWQINSVSEEHRACVPETETSFSKAQPQVFPAHEITFTTTALAPVPSQSGRHPVQEMSLPQVVARPSLATNTFIKQSTGQLTVFYLGTVNMYDDVPVDRANALMVLAGTGNVLPLKQSSDGNKEATPATLKSLSLPATRPLHSMSTSNLMGQAPHVSPAVANIGKALGCSAVPAVSIPTSTLITAISSPSTHLPAPSFLLEPKPQAGIKRLQLGIELPHARKASLARFLEKRKTGCK